MALNIVFLPAAVQAVVQQGILEGRFLDALKPETRWRLLAQRKRHTGSRMGESVTMTRPGLISPSTEAQATLEAGKDPGLVTRSIEQFTYQLRSMGKGLDIHLPSSHFAQASTFLDDSEKLAIHAAMSLDGIARDRLIKAYKSGDTFTTAAQGGGGSTTVPVEDTTGFETVLVNGVPTAVSAQNTLPIKIGNTAKLVSAVDAVNKTLTITVAGTWSQYDRVLADDAPTIVRQTSRATDRLIVAGDTPTIATFRTARAQLADHFVPRINGAYPCFVDEATQNALFADAEFHDAIQADGAAAAFATGYIGRYAGIDFYTLPQERMPATLSGGNYQTTIHRSLMFGADVLVEAYLPEPEFEQEVTREGIATANHAKMPLDDDGVLTMIYRAPLDRLGRTIGAAWAANLDYCVPTDAGGLSGKQRYKRAILIHTAGP